MTMEEQVLERGIEQGLERGQKMGIETGKAQGQRINALDNARKMLERGLSWDVITDVTGIKPEDLA